MSKSTTSLDELRSKYFYGETAFSDWYTQTEEYYLFYLGDQFTREQRDAWEAGGLPLLQINEIRPRIDHQAAYLVSHTPRFAAAPVGFGDEKIANIAKDMLIWRWNELNGNTEMLVTIRNALIMGVGYIKAYIDKGANFGKDHVSFAAIHPHDIIPDPDSKFWDWRDAEVVFHRADMKRHFIEKRWANKKLNFKNMEISAISTIAEHRLVAQAMGISLGYSDIDPSSEMYRVIEAYSKVTVPFVSLWDENGFIRGAVPADEMNGKEAVVRALGLEWREYEEARIKTTVFSGEQLIEEGILPISDFPVIPFYNSHDGTPTGTSEIMFLKDPQKALNSSMNLIIAHTANSTNSPWVYEKNSVDDEIMESAGVQGAKIPYNRGFNPPRRDPPPQVSSALFSLPSALSRHMDDLSGSYPLSRGDPAQSPETFRAGLQIEENSSRKLELKRRMIMAGVTKLGNIMFRLMQSVYDEPEVIRVTAPQGNRREFIINQKTPYGEFNKLTNGAVNIQVIPDSMVGTSIQAKEARALERLKLGVVTKKHYIMQSDLTDKEELVNELDEIEQAKGTINSLQGEIKKLNLRVYSLENALIRAKETAEIVKFKSQLRRQLDKSELDARKAIQSIK